MRGDVDVWREWLRHCVTGNKMKQSIFEADNRYRGWGGEGELNNTGASTGTSFAAQEWNVELENEGQWSGVFLITDQQ
jgi:hypothetical protein